MKTIITIIITLFIAVPVITYAISGMIEYQTINLSGPWGTATKFYDHDEGVLCYVYDGVRAGGISCIKE